MELPPYHLRLSDEAAEPAPTGKGQIGEAEIAGGADSAQSRLCSPGCAVDLLANPIADVPSVQAVGGQ